MIETTPCPGCQGSGVTLVETSSAWGLIKRTAPMPCRLCAGKGTQTTLPACELCLGHGLIGNEKEICRTCNGTGKVDSFALIPLELVAPGTTFQRRCDQCSNDLFEIVSAREQHRVFKSWEEIEELREIELVERVRVTCTTCPNGYFIQVDPRFHQEVSPEQAHELEQMGLNLGFLYQIRPGGSTAQQDGPRA